MAYIVFQSTISRTAGFNSVDMASVHYSTAVILMILMFIGGSPASTAGGLKTTTFGVILATTISVCKGERDVVFFKENYTKRYSLKSNSNNCNLFRSSNNSYSTNNNSRSR